MSKLQLFALEASRGLGEKISTELGIPLSPHEERAFEDGEHKSRPLVNVRGDDVFVNQSLFEAVGVDRIAVMDVHNLAAYQNASRCRTDRSRLEFLRRVTENLRHPTIESEAATRAVFTVLSKHVSRGELQDIERVLPADIQALWR